jgi:hypothetical protein
MTKDTIQYLFPEGQFLASYLESSSSIVFVNYLPHLLRYLEGIHFSYEPQDNLTNCVKLRGPGKYNIG